MTLLKDEGWTWDIPNQAVKCPVCNGIGKVDRTMPTDNQIRNEICNGCNGQGWVKI